MSTPAATDSREFNESELMSWVGDIPKEAYTIIGTLSGRVIGALASVSGTIFASRNQRKTEESKLAAAKKKELHDSVHQFAADYTLAVTAIGEVTHAAFLEKAAFSDWLAGRSLSEI